MMKFAALVAQLRSLDARSAVVAALSGWLAAVPDDRLCAAIVAVPLVAGLRASVLGSMLLDHADGRQATAEALEALRLGTASLTQVAKTLIALTPKRQVSFARVVLLLVALLQCCDWSSKAERSVLAEAVQARLQPQVNALPSQPLLPEARKQLGILLLMCRLS